MKIFTFNQLNKNIPSWMNVFIKVLFLLAASAFVLSIVFLGIGKVSQLFLPVVVPLGKGLVLIFLCIICPLSLIKSCRPWLVIPTYSISYLLAGCSWLYSLLFVIGTLGFWGVLFCFLFQTLTPITLIGAIFNGSWDVVGLLAVWLVFTYVMRIYSLVLTLGSLWKEGATTDDRVIDIEAKSKDE